jgi:hypothetical protein
MAGLSIPPTFDLAFALAMAERASGFSAFHNSICTEQLQIICFLIASFSLLLAGCSTIFVDFSQRLGNITSHVRSRSFAGIVVAKASLDKNVDKDVEG